MIKLVERILNSRGYYKIDMPEKGNLSEADVLEIMRDIGENKHFSQFLRTLCEQDIKLYFNATNDRDRGVIRGAHDRSLYFLSLIHKANKKQKAKRSSDKTISK